MGVISREKLWGSTSLVLALSLALAGCSGSSNNGESASSAPSGSDSGGASASAADDLKPITISAFINSPNQAPTPDNRIYKKIKDELGVTLNMEFLVGDLQQKLGVMIAGGEYPDLITADTKLVAAKAIIPLEDLIEQYAPHLKEHFAPVWNKMKDSSDGHIYWLPNFGVVSGQDLGTYYSGPAFWIQKEILKEAGYPTPKSLDDYFKLIRDYAQKHPTIDGQPTIGFTTLATTDRNWPLLNAPEHLTGHPNDGGVVVDNNVASVFADKDAAKKYYQVLNGIYNEGLMDKESFVQNYDQYLAKISSGRVLGMFDQHWNFQPAEDTLVSQGKIPETYVGFPITYDSSIPEYYRDSALPNLNNGFGISKDAKDPVRIIKFLDALMTEDWQKTLSWGQQDIDYKVGTDGKFSRTPEQRKQQEDVTWKLANRADAFYGALPKLEGTYSDGNATSAGNQPGEYYDSLKPEDKELLDAYGHKTWVEFFTPHPQNPVYYPSWQIDLIDGSPASIANKQMVDASLKYVPKAVMSKPDKFDSVWGEYVNAYKKIDVKAYEDRVNEQIQWRIKNWATAK